MPKLLRARAPQDTAEEQKVRKLANSRHAPGDWIMRTRMIALSWDGLRTAQIASKLRLLEAVAQANPTGDLYLITDNLSSHKSPPIREWLENPTRE